MLKGPGDEIIVLGGTVTTFFVVKGPGVDIIGLDGVDFSAGA